MALFLVMGLFGTTAAQPANASTTQYATVTITTPVAKVVSASYTSLKLSWTAVTGATGYKVYRATSSTGTYAYRGATANLSYTNSNLTTGKYYYYKVVAYKTVNGVTTNSKSSAVVYAKPIPATPTSSVISRTMTSAKIYWTGVPAATKYQVYRATSATGSYSLVYTASSTARNYTNTGLTHGRTYYYKVRAYHLEGTTKVYGYCASAKSVKIGSVYYSGTYKIGTDIPAGEYLLTANNDDAFYFTSNDAAGDDWVGLGSPNPTLYATLRTGDYVTLESTKAYPVATAPKVAVKADGSFLPGQYKVGRDIPAGTYVINFPATTNYGYMFIESNSFNENDATVGYDFYRGRIYVTLMTGQYFSFDLGIGYPIATAPALDKSQPDLHDGMYLVGTDIPAGTYTIHPKNDFDGYYVVYNNATHTDASILDYADLDAEKTVTVNNGEYLFIIEGYFTQQELVL